MLCFTRDTDVLSVFNNSTGHPILTPLKGRPSEEVIYPPNGIVPFHGFTMYGEEIRNTVLWNKTYKRPIFYFYFKSTNCIYLFFSAAPMCYLFDDPVPLYYTFRAFYMRYWFRLHEISSHPQSILGLCILFQRLLQRHETKIWSHFMNHNIHP